MFVFLIINKPKTLRTLVAALDWGLGHAARCVPIIEALEKEGREVILGTAGRAAALWKTEFSHLRQVELPAYSIRYPYASMYANMLLQGPRISGVALAEHLLLRRLVARLKIEAIISDNRFGCFHPGVCSIYLTHQIHIPLANAWAGALVNAIHHGVMSCYDECWIPDWPDEAGSIAGKLAHPGPAKGLVRYIGPLSRLHPPAASDSYQVVALLSGPEPQRSIFEALICQQAGLLQVNMLVVQGKPEQAPVVQSMPGYDIVPHLPAPQLAGVIAGAQLLIARSGYSTLMDFARLGKPALLVPTPGQPEQIYLAEYWQQKGWACVQQQHTLNIEKAFDAVRQLGAPMLPGHQVLLQEAVRNLNK